MARKISDPLALAVEQAVNKILGQDKPLSTALIAKSTIYRISWTFDARGEHAAALMEAMDKFVAAITAKLAKLNLDMSRVKVSWYFVDRAFLHVKVKLADVNK